MPKIALDSQAFLQYALSSTRMRIVANDHASYLQVLRLLRDNAVKIWDHDASHREIVTSVLDSCVGLMVIEANASFNFDTLRTPSDALNL